MAKKEWGTKRTCPKCGTRFYDLGNDEPIVCIDCGESWKHEPILKARPSVVPRPEKKTAEIEDKEEMSDDIEIDDEVASLLVETDDDSDDDDSVIADVSLDDDDDNLSEVVDVNIIKGDDE